MRRLLTALSGLVLWAQETGLDVDADVLLARDMIDRYAAVGLDGYSDGTRRHVRSDLDRLALAHGLEVPARALGSAAGDEPPEDPYGPDEVDALLSWADGQPWRHWRRSLLVLLALGLGCRLTNADIRSVTGDGVVVHDDGLVMVRVGGTAHARSSASGGSSGSSHPSHPRQAPRGLSARRSSRGRCRRSLRLSIGPGAARVFRR